jgi:integrase
MSNRAVSIYENVGKDGKNKWVPVDFPALKPGGSLYLKDDRPGNFYISWYEGESPTTGLPRKRWKKVKGRNTYKSGKVYATLTDAVNAVRAKEWELQYPERVKPVDEPTNGRLRLDAAIYSFTSGLSGSPKTVKAYERLLLAFKKYSGVSYVDEITRGLLLRWKAKLEQKNDPLTAVWKLIRINKFYKTVLMLPHGAGLIKTTEFKDVLKKKPKIVIYSADELKKFFAACDGRQFILFQLYYKCGLRNKELAHLEWDDIDLDRREINIQDKKMKDGTKEIRWKPKHGSEGKVVIPQTLVPLLKTLKSQSKSKLVFPTRKGRVDTKLLDQCKLVARRAGFEEDRWTIKSFRSTYATSRLRTRQYDLATLREQMRHKDQQSIEHYIDYLKNEELIASGKVDAGWDA